MSDSRLSLRKRIALNLFRNYRLNEARLHKLSYIFWECTLRCNLKCLHCGSDCTSNSAIQDMPSRDFLTALDSLKPLVLPNETMIVLTGGEPLLRKDIPDIGLQLYKRGFPWGLVTNGMLLDQRKLNSLLQSGLRSVTVSFDGLEDSHNWLRGNKLSFKNAVNAISLLPKTGNLIYDVVTCVHERNFHELVSIRDRLISLGVSEWRIFTIFPTGRAKDNPELQLSARNFKFLFEFIKQTRKEAKIKLNYGCEGFLGQYEAEARDGFFHCKAGINIASVLADGSIAACPNLRGNFIQGNIYTGSLADTWETKYEKFRNKDWTKVGICADCSFYKYCEGNGMHLRNEETGELLFCHLQRIEEGRILS
jgi:radical SAM enzyme (rSAM/lipoprotein system)